MARTRVKLAGRPPFRGSEAERLIRRAARAAVAAFNLPFGVRIDIALMDDSGIHALNVEHRNVDRPTDVLSFPMQEFFEGEPRFDAARETENGRVFLGDVAISLERAREQAEQYGHSFARECGYLTVHSVLHLLGFDHQTAHEQDKMRRREEEILKRIGLERVLHENQ